jgi:nucleoid DNA-binding protein
MNLNTLVREISNRTRLPQQDIKRVIVTLQDVIIEAVGRGQRIELQNFLVIEVGLLVRSVKRLTAVGWQQRKETFRVVRIRPGQHLSAVARRLNQQGE